MNNLEGKITGYLVIAPSRIRSEIFFRKDDMRFCFADKLLKDLDGATTTYDQIRIANPQILIERVQALIQEIFATCRRIREGWVKDKYRNNEAGFQSRLKRCVIRQSQVTADPPNGRHEN